MGTAILEGEDLATRGHVYVFDVISVVPEPDRPETGFKLKLISVEEVRGGVTALSKIGTRGLFLMAQGQKCMVRGLKDDDTLDPMKLKPVAFMDMQPYVTVAKELKGTGLLLLGDALKGVWFAGHGVSLQPATSQHAALTSNRRRSPIV